MVIRSRFDVGDSVWAKITRSYHAGCTHCSSFGFVPHGADDGYVPSPPTKRCPVCAGTGEEIQTKEIIVQATIVAFQYSIDSGRKETWDWLVSYEGNSYLVREPNITELSKEGELK